MRVRHPVVNADSRFRFLSPALCTSRSCNAQQCHTVLLRLWKEAKEKGDDGRGHRRFLAAELPVLQSLQHEGEMGPVRAICADQSLSMGLAVATRLRIFAVKPGGKRPITYPPDVASGLRSKPSQVKILYSETRIAEGGLRFAAWATSWGMGTASL